MRSSRLAAAFALLLSGSAHAQTTDPVETVRRDIAAALSTPLPITVIGPLIAADIRVTPDGDAFRVDLDNPLVMGIVPLGPVSFRVAPEEGGTLYRVTDFRLPSSIDVFNMATLAIGSTTFDGLWSPQTRSYRTLDFRLGEVSVRPAGMEGAEVALGSLGLNVAKEGVSGATQSRIALTATDLSERGLAGDDLRLGRLEAELTASGREPVDLYAVIARFAVLSMMQQDSSQLLQFAESLRVRRYDAVALGFRMEGLDVTGSVPARHIAAKGLTGRAAITDMTPAAWGRLAFDVDAEGVSQQGYASEARTDMARAHAGISGAQIPIGATLKAVGGLRALASGAPVRILVTDLLDGFADIGALALDTGIDAMTIRPVPGGSAGYRVGSAGTHLGLAGFRDGKGTLSLALSAQDMDLGGMAPGDAPRDAVARRIFRTLAPTDLRYDVSVSDLDEALLRRLMTGLAIATSDDAVALVAPGLAYVMAMRPLVETKDARFRSREIDVALASSVRLYPAWLLSALPFEGTQHVTLAGFDMLTRLLDDLDRKPRYVAPADIQADGSGADGYDGETGGTGGADPGGVALVRGLLATVKALSRKEDGRLVWDAAVPEAGKPLFTVNGITLRFPDFAAYAPLIGMGYGWSAL